VSVAPAPGAATGTANATASASAGRVEALRVKAPANTRFAIATHGQDEFAIDCTATSATGTDYEVRCPRQDGAQDLLSTISFGDFDYGFTHALK